MCGAWLGTRLTKLLVDGFTIQSHSISGFVCNLNLNNRNLCAAESTLQHLLGGVLRYPGPASLVGGNMFSLAPLTCQVAELLHRLVGQQVVSAEPVLRQTKMDGEPPDPPIRRSQSGQHHETYLRVSAHPRGPGPVQLRLVDAILPSLTHQLGHLPVGVLVVDSSGA